MTFTATIRQERHAVAAPRHGRKKSLIIPIFAPSLDAEQAANPPYVHTSGADGHNGLQEPPIALDAVAGRDGDG